MKFANIPLCALALTLAALIPLAARASACPAPANRSSLDVPGHPFGIAVSADGCWLFVSMRVTSKHGALAVLHDRDGRFAVERVVAMRNVATGNALTSDGSMLAVTAGDRVAMFSVAALEQASGDPQLGTLRLHHGAGAVYAIATPDNRLLFVSEERKRRIGVFDLARWRAHKFKGNPHLGDIPTGFGPAGLALSPDGHWLYATSEVAPRSAGFAPSCKPENKRERMHPQGLLTRIDVAKAARDPRASVAGILQAGCNPVRVAVSPDGIDLWVTARGDNALLRIPARAFATTRRHVDVGRFHVGVSPIGVAVRPDGRQVWGALSNRFSDATHDSSGMELAGLLGAGNPHADSLGVIHKPASGFPRELAFLPDGRTLVVGLFAARRIEFVATPR